MSAYIRENLNKTQRKLFEIFVLVHTCQLWELFVPQISMDLCVGGGVRQLLDILKTEGSLY